MLKNKWKELLVITQIESLYQLYTTSFHYNKYQLRKGRGGWEDLQFFFQYALPHPSYFIDDFSSTQNISSAIFILPSCLHFAPVWVLTGLLQDIFTQTKELKLVKKFLYLVCRSFVLCKTFGILTNITRGMEETNAYLKSTNNIIYRYCFNS